MSQGWKRVPLIEGDGGGIPPGSLYPMRQDHVAHNGFLARSTLDAAVGKVRDIFAALIRTEDHCEESLAKAYHIVQNVFPPWFQFFRWPCR